MSNGRGVGANNFQTAFRCITVDCRERFESQIAEPRVAVRDNLARHIQPWLGREGTRDLTLDTYR